LIGALFVTAVAQPGAAAPRVVVLAERVVDGTETHEDAVVFIAGHVRVNGSLSLARVDVIAAPGAMVSVAGTAVIEGPTTIAGGPLSFEVASGGILRIDGTQARGASIVSAGTLEIDGAHLDGSGGDLVRVEAGGSLLARDVVLAPGAGVGVRSLDGDVRLTEVTITGALGYGVAIDGGSLEATGLVVENAADYGLRADHASIRIDGSSFTGHCGAYLGPGTTGALDDVTFTTTDHGLTLAGSGKVSVTDVGFTGGSIGLSALGAPLDVTDIVATDVSIGVVALDASGTITGGRIAAGTAVEIDGTLTPAIHSLDIASSAVGVRNRTGTETDARWNWWGGAPSSGSTEGPVLVDPWLAEPPA